MNEMLDTRLKEDSEVFSALADPKRLAILALLREGEKCACVLLSHLEMTQPGLSYHMKILCASGLVCSRQEGKWTYYSLAMTGIEKVSRLMGRYVAATEAQKQGRGCDRGGCRCGMKGKDASCCRGKDTGCSGGSEDSCPSCNGGKGVV